MPQEYLLGASKQVKVEYTQGENHEIIATVRRPGEEPVQVMLETVPPVQGDCKPPQMLD